MVDYWQYKTVHYWTNVISRKRTFCLDEGFFKVAEILCEKERLVELIRGEMSEELLHEIHVSCAVAFFDTITVGRDLRARRNRKRRNVNQGGIEYDVCRLGKKVVGE